MVVDPLPQAPPAKAVGAPQAGASHEDGKAAPIAKRKTMAKVGANNCPKAKASGDVYVSEAVGVLPIPKGAPPPTAKGKAAPTMSVSKALSKDAIGRSVENEDKAKDGTAEDAAVPKPKVMVRDLQLTSSEGKLFCNDCNEFVEVANCRLVGKKDGPKFRCKACACTKVRLWRGFGTNWPPACWEQVPADEQARFYKDAHLMSQSAVIDSATKLIDSYTRNEDYYEHGGSYLPLSVWKQQGYDIERIEQLSAPKISWRTGCSERFTE